MPTVHLLDYVAGNVRSLLNAIEKLGYTVEWIRSPADVPKAEVWPYSKSILRQTTDPDRYACRNSSSPAWVISATV